jgi:CP family cyanate transporter-like MFS transporter
MRTRPCRPRWSHTGTSSIATDATAQRSNVRFIAALFVAGLGLRAQIVAIGPLAPQIAGDLGVSFAVTGLLATLPLFLMGVASIPAAAIGHRFGERITIAAFLALIGLAAAARALAPGVGAVLALTVPIGLGIGIVGVVLPVFVSTRASSRRAMASGAYVSGIILGSAIAVATAVPLSIALGGWREPLFWSAVAILFSIGVWVALVPPDRCSDRRPLSLPHLPWRRGVAWLLVALFALQALLFFGLITWITPALIERGWEPTQAGAVGGVISVFALVGSLAVAGFGDRLGRRMALVSASTACLVAFAGLAAAPFLAWAWAFLAGVSLGAIFALVVILPIDAAGHGHTTGDYSALMLGAGYVIASAAPAVMGAMRDLSGSFSSGLLLLAGLALLLVAAAALTNPARLRTPFLGLPPLP